LANRVIGSITADLTRATPVGGSGETTLGNVIADAQLAATQKNGAQIAITNPGGIRTDLTYAASAGGEQPGQITYGEAFAVQPFGNVMQTVTMTGAQLDEVLEEQFRTGNTRITLQISSGFSYTMDPDGAPTERVSNLTLDGTAIDPAASYRVSINNFLAGGGDGFSVFTEATDVTAGPIDLDALVAYFATNSPIPPPPLNRIVVV